MYYFHNGKGTTALFYPGTGSCIRGGSQQNIFIALFVMMPVFYVAGNELILSVGRFSTLIRFERRKMKIFDVFFLFCAQIFEMINFSAPGKRLDWHKFANTLSCYRNGFL